MLREGVRGLFRRGTRRGFRRATVHRRALPNFIIIGVQGGGTTSLYEWLKGHPRIQPAFGKELHYFDSHFAKGERWYRSRFPVTRAGMITGEATPYTFLHPLAPARIAQVLPDDTALLVLLRNPTDRAISRYHHACRQGWETESLERALALEPQRMEEAEVVVMAGRPSPQHQFLSYVSGGHYADLLRRWHEHVGPDRVVVVESEELFCSAPARDDLLAALGLESLDLPFPQLNSVTTPGGDTAVRRQLDDYFHPLNEDLFALLDRRFWEK
jgi:hypothetical protein